MSQMAINERYAEPWSAIRTGTLQDQWPRHVRGNVLELGAASGRNASLLPPSASYVGLERDEALLQRGQQQGLDLRLCDLANANDLRAQCAAIAAGDTILALDVLEHLLEPANLLRDVLTMAPDRHRWVISIPNAVFVSARLEILIGRFPRRPSGLFDATHRQFYTKSTLQTHLLSALNVAPAALRLYGTAVPLGGSRLGRRSWTARAIPILAGLAASTARNRPELFAYEWLAVVDVGH